MIGKSRIERRSVPALEENGLSSVHPLLRRIYAARGAVLPEHTEHRLATLLSPLQLGGIQYACELLEHALRTQQHIVIVGDFDADGATGTAVAVRGLRMLGASHVGYGVPNRFTHGYGLSAVLVEELAVLKPDMLITVDNGIAANAGVDAAKRLGIRVIVTDHHLPGAVLPNADAIVNPNLTGDGFPSKALAGVGVMFYLLLALRTHLRECGWFSTEKNTDARPLTDSDASKTREPDLSSLLDLVALGTVADLVPLDQNNRILVDAGLRRIRAGRACAGIAALIAAGNREGTKVTASDLGFVVAPRINAAGRLDDMRLGIECLLSDDAAQARVMAERLSAINAQRRELQTEMTEQAQLSVERWMAQHGSAALPFGIVLYEAQWHPGVVGLVASRLKENLHRPVIACALAGEGSDEIRASGRSIAGFHLRDALVEVDARRPGLLHRFGGHAMAAGMTLSRADIAEFAELFALVARERIAPELLDSIVLTDGEIEAGDFSLEVAQLLRYASPWGQAFPEPLFDAVFLVESWRVMGEIHLRLRLRHEAHAQSFDAVMFQAYVGVAPPTRVRAAFALQIDEWNNAQTLRLLLRYWEPA